MKDSKTALCGDGVIKKGDPFAYLGHFMNKKFMSEGHNQGAPGEYGDQPVPGTVATPPPVGVAPQPAAPGVSAKPPKMPAVPVAAQPTAPAPRRSNMPPATGGGLAGTLAGKKGGGGSLGSMAGGASPNFKSNMAGDYQKNIAAGEAERSKLRAATQGLRTSQQAMRQAMPGAPRGAKGQTSQYGRPRGGSRRGR